MTYAALIRLVDRLEDEADSYVTLGEVEAAGGECVTEAIAEGVLLIDHRTQLDGRAVILCRLNRHHPLVAQQTGW